MLTYEESCDGESKSNGQRRHVSSWRREIIGLLWCRVERMRVRDRMAADIRTLICRRIAVLAGIRGSKPWCCEKPR